jgi:hypothetical protein
MKQSKPERADHAKFNSCDFSDVTLFIVLASLVSYMMKKQIFTVFLLSSFFLAAGCDSSSQNVQVQDISEIEWQSDGSAIYGFLQSYISTVNTSTPSTGYDIAKFDAGGSLVHTYTNSVKARFFDPATGEVDSYSPVLYLSSDGSTIVTQFEGDLYRFKPASNTLEKLITQFHLIVVSPDLHYAIGTPSPSIQPTKTLDGYDISVSPPRQIFHLPYVSLAASITGIWLSGGTFGVTLKDSVGTNIAIYDTIGTLRQDIPGAETAFHNTFFNKQTNDFFFLNHAGKTSDYSVDKMNLTTSARTNILNFAVENFDVTSDEQIIVYGATDSVHQTKSGVSLKIRNLQTSQEAASPLATDNLAYVILSPVADKVAYLSGDVNFKQIRVIPFTRP